MTNRNFENPDLLRYHFNEGLSFEFVAHQSLATEIFHNPLKAILNRSEHFFLSTVKSLRDLRSVKPIDIPMDEKARDKFIEIQVEVLHKRVWDRVIKILKEVPPNDDPPYSLKDIEKIVFNLLRIEKEDRPINDCYFCELSKLEAPAFRTVDCDRCAYFEIKCDEVDSLWRQLFSSIFYGPWSKAIPLAKQIRDAKPDPRNLR
jgi:hypothetical protein